MLGYPLPKCSTRKTSETNKPVFTDLCTVARSSGPIEPLGGKTNPKNTNNVKKYLVLINPSCNSKKTT